MLPGTQSYSQPIAVRHIVIPVHIHYGMCWQPLQALRIGWAVTTRLHKGPKLRHSDRVTGYVVAWQRDPVPELFVVIGQQVPLRTPHPEHSSRNLHKPQQRLVR